MAQKNAVPDTMQMVAELEVEMMSDMYKRMTNACQQKCVASHYREGDLTKGEAVCLDRCVAKYLDVHERLGKVLTAMTQHDDKQLQQIQQQSKKQTSSCLEEGKPQREIRIPQTSAVGPDRCARPSEQCPSNKNKS